MIEITNPDQLVEMIESIRTNPEMAWETTVFKYSRKTTSDILRLAWEMIPDSEKQRFGSSYDVFLKQNADHPGWRLHSYAYRILHHKD